MHLPITKFGNLAQADAIRLADAIEAEAAQWAPVLLGLAAGVAPNPAPGTPISLELDGDPDALDRVVQGVPRVAQRLQLFVDRRVFAPYLTVGAVNHLTTAEMVESLLDTMASLNDITWVQTSVSLLLSSATASDGLGPVSFREIPLGPGPH